MLIDKNDYNTSYLTLSMYSMEIQEFNHSIQPIRYMCDTTCHQLRMWEKPYDVFLNKYNM